MKKRIIIIGGGGHAKVVIDAVKLSGEYNIVGIIDPGFKKGTCVAGVEVIGADNLLKEVFASGTKNAFIGVGSIGDCSIRKRIYSVLISIGFKLPTIIHLSAIVAQDAIIEDGSFIAAGVVINPGTRIGKNAIINTSSSIDHDCVIGDFVHIAPGVTLCGGVKVGDETHIGAGANIIQGVKIGLRRMVPAGSLIMKDIPDGEKV